MTALRVSLEVVVDDADRCGGQLVMGDPKCSYDEVRFCSLRGNLDRRPLLPIPSPEATQAPPVYGRTKACRSLESLAAADDAVLSAAEKWGDDEDVTFVEANAQADALEDAIDARRKLRTPKGTG